MRYYKKALKIYQRTKGKKHPSTATVLDHIGTVYHTKGEYSEAIESYEKVLSIYREVFGEKHHSTAISYNRIGEVYCSTNDFPKAIQYFKIALSIYINVFGEKHPYTNQIQINLANSFEKSAQYDDADSLWNIIIPNIEDQLQKNYLYIPDKVKLIFLNTADEKFRQFYAFMSQHGSDSSKETAANLLVNSKAQILDYSIASRQIIKGIKDEKVDSLVTILNQIKQAIAQCELMPKVERKRTGCDLSDLWMLYDEYAMLILELPQLKDKLNYERIDWKQIQQKLSLDEAVIDYFAFYDRIDSIWFYQAMLLKKDEPKPLFVPLSPTSPVLNLLKKGSHIPDYLLYKETMQEMYSYIWQAFEPYLKNIKTMHVVPVASLSKIDFESLQNKEGQYLADLYNFHYYTSSRDVKQKQANNSYQNVTLYGGLTYYCDKYNKENENNSASRITREDSLVYLPASLDEVHIIDSICNIRKVASTLITNATAKEDTLKYFSGSHAPDVIHLATHGGYLPYVYKKKDRLQSGQELYQSTSNPLQRSIIMLSNAGHTWHQTASELIAKKDGILTALEVTDLDLYNTKLVVLSACSTGIGYQHTTEGVFGLPRAFKLAGVDKILVSLWPVEDETTKELMIQFYTNLLQHKQDAATALRNAKAEMRKRNELPKKWAGFVLVE